MSDEGLEARIEAAGREARVVLVGSALTDLRDVERRLEQAGVAQRTLRLPMGEADNRDSFRELAERTGSRSLPQCFLDGEFVGGPLELYEKLGLKAPVGTGSGERLIGLAQALGYGGLIPFVIGGVLVLLLGQRTLYGVDTVFFVASYAAVILSFVGAVHWGVALAGPVRPFKARLMMALSVLPSLLAWAALLAGPATPVTVLVLFCGFVAWWLYEWAVPGKRVLARWYLRLRLQLSSVAALVLLLVWLRLLLAA